VSAVRSRCPRRTFRAKTKTLIARDVNNKVNAHNTNRKSSLYFLQVFHIAADMFIVCINNFRWMVVHCASTCGYCGEGLPRLNPTLVQKAAPLIVGRPTADTMQVEVGASGDAVDGVCRDIDKTCADRVIHGQCDRYPVWSSQNCAKSCGDCDGSRSAANLKRREYLRKDDGSGCFDLHEDCFERAMDGGCKGFDTYMFKGCRRSCKKCQPNEPDLEVDSIHTSLLTQDSAPVPFTEVAEKKEENTRECKDLISHCDDIVRLEGCEKNKG